MSSIFSCKLKKLNTYHVSIGWNLDPFSGYGDNFSNFITLIRLLNFGPLYSKIISSPDFLELAWIHDCMYTHQHQRSSWVWLSKIN